MARLGGVGCNDRQSRGAIMAACGCAPPTPQRERCWEAQQRCWAGAARRTSGHHLRVVIVLEILYAIAANQMALSDASVQCAVGRQALRSVFLHSLLCSATRRPAMMAHLAVGGTHG